MKDLELALRKPYNSYLPNTYIFPYNRRLFNGGNIRAPQEPISILLPEVQPKFTSRKGGILNGIPGGAIFQQTSTDLPLSKLYNTRPFSISEDPHAGTKTQTSWSKRHSTNHQGVFDSKNLAHNKHMSYEGHINPLFSNTLG